MSDTIKINEFADKLSLALTDIIPVVEDGTNTNYKTTLDKIQTFLNSIGVSGYKGIVTPNVNGIPQLDNVGGNITENGFYIVSENGNYGNFTNLNISNNFIILGVEDISTTPLYSKAEIPITLTIDATPTEGSANAVQSGGVFDALSLKTDQTDFILVRDNQTSIPEFEPYTNFDTNGDNVVLDNELIFEDDGDFIKFEVRLDDLGTTTTPYGMGIIGKAGGFTLGFWSSGALYIRRDNATWITTNGFLTPVVSGEKFKIKLEWNSVDGIKTYKDGVFQKNLTFEPFNLQVYGNSYNTASGATFRGGIKNIKLKAKGVDYDIPILLYSQNITNNGAELEPQTTFLTPEEKGKLNSLGSVSADTFFTLDIDGSSTGDELFTVYQKIRDDIYAGFDIHHVIDAGIQSNLWRIVECWEYTFDGVTMSKTSNELLTGGESEFAYRTNDAGGSPNGDFTGGIHGDEIQISAKFFASGVEITDITSDIPLTACNNFYYTNQTHTKAFGTTNNEALHDKLTFIENSGYRCFNRIKWLLIPNSIDRWYHGISCVGNDCGETIHNEYLETASFTDNDDSFKLANVPAREYYSTNNTTNFSAFVTSKLIQPINEDVNCGMKVWDRTVGGGNDNKYYRTFIPSSNPSINDIWESEMVVKFNKL